ncbi:MAG TPA: MFS transporter [Candidatus Dormibacteraeota bacterium]|jgi:predicted MFS family arabinose efflux permease
MREGGFNVRLLSAGPFMTMMDRFAFAPVLIPIAVEFRAPVGAVAIAATAYYFAYGLAQPFWGFASDRAGRIKIIRVSLSAAAVACALSALAPNLNFLIAARILAGASVCAVLPTALVYVGDMVPFKARHSVIADLLAAVAFGTAAGSLGSGFFGHYLSWRVIFGITAVIAVGLAIALGRLPESSAPPTTGGPVEQLRQVFRRPWARFLILFAIPEGAMVIGFLVYFAPALEATGTNSAVAGLVVATYGGAVLAGTRVVKWIAPRTPAWVPISVGGAMSIAGYLVAALDQHAIAILIASVLIGGCYAIFHSTMQNWATDIAPEVRGTATALFVTGAFTGGAIGSGLGALFVQQHLYGPLFLVAAALSSLVVITAAFTRARYPGSGLAIPVEELAGS